LDPDQRDLVFTRPNQPVHQRELVRLACHIYDARRARDRLLGIKMFGEPAWDMLLACYCLPARGETLTVTALSYAANVPPTTGHRWQQVLIKKGLIEKAGRRGDARRQFIKLSRSGKELLEEYLTRLFYCETPLPPLCEEAGG
jgi:DNA-binding MarR family transcriptional regulator